MTIAKNTPNLVIGFYTFSEWFLHFSEWFLHFSDWFLLKTEPTT